METNAIDAHVGKRMRELREARMVLLADLARQIGIAPTELADYEAGRVRASKVLYLYCRSLNVEIWQVFEGLPPGRLGESVGDSSCEC
jgi:transcriptional regulator with XRE-family HTH domain